MPHVKPAHTDAEAHTGARLTSCAAEELLYVTQCFHLYKTRHFITQFLSQPYSPANNGTTLLQNPFCSRPTWSVWRGPHFPRSPLPPELAQIAHKESRNRKNSHRQWWKAARLEGHLTLFANPAVVFQWMLPLYTCTRTHTHTPIHTHTHTAVCSVLACRLFFSSIKVSVCILQHCHHHSHMALC